MRKGDDGGEKNGKKTGEKKKKRKTFLVATNVLASQLSQTILSEYLRLFMATILDNLKQLSLTISY